ncbi:hypothetical protein Sgly_0776 [Syntrophobotulus glycolicus DSM 8271]|uniref:Tail sheath protein C-terminal domain-containing protein n=1 Tax=Syntrophobotulus glycolicus (strain DSM 8271 / FlGlyR) TaxID=645991 RepID=F0T169_SYNGF|nr:phage tail sheath C-terminal domain-containing protein [Syntrophobotulus glycolicus]ADY55133.1 hypothetical protein Sgly_0776 [Syntrophobotulus glycolicus DSM 8271]
MANEYIEPRIAIDESDVGSQIQPEVSLSGIGIVGTFEKGPVNQAVFIQSANKLKSVFGSDKAGLTGIKSALGALNQGASDLKIVRIGTASIKAAERMLKDSTDTDSVKVTAASPGTWGNEIKVAVAEGTLENTFRIIVVYGSESETLDNLTLNNLGSVVSQYVTLDKVEGAAQNPKNVTAAPLTDGDDGATTTDSDYVGAVDENGAASGLRVLETAQVGLVLCAQQYGTTVQNAIIAHCANASIGQGLRVGILNTNKGLTPGTVAALTASLDSDRAIVTYPWVEPSEAAGAYVAPDGYYAGLLAVRNSNTSPSNKPMLGIKSTERDLTDADVKALTLARISPITLMPRRGGFVVRNGVTLSASDAWSQTCIRRAADEINMEAYDAIQWAISAENTPELRAAVAAQLDAMLLTKKQKGRIYDYQSTICDDTNNTAESIAARILNAVIRPRFTYPADYVNLFVQRQTGSGS